MEGKQEWVMQHKSLAGTSTSLLDAKQFCRKSDEGVARSTKISTWLQTRAPSDGVITPDMVCDDDKLVYVCNQDTICIKQLLLVKCMQRRSTRLYDLAMKTGAPVIGLVISILIIRLQEATDALEAFGRIYLKQTLASGVIRESQQSSARNMRRWYGGYPSLTNFTFLGIQKGKCSSTHQTHWKETTQDKCDTAAADFRNRERNCDRWRWYRGWRFLARSVS